MVSSEDDGSQSGQTIPGVGDVDPGAGVDDYLVILHQRKSAPSGLEKVSDPSELVQLAVDLTDVLQIYLRGMLSQTETNHSLESLNEPGHPP